MTAGEKVGLSPPDRASKFGLLVVCCVDRVGRVRGLAGLRRATAMSSERSIVNTNSCIVCFLVMVSALSAAGSDWPAYRRDARRSAVSDDRLEFPLQAVWRRQARLVPRPAFEDPLKHPTNIDFAFIRDFSQPVLLDFDHAFHPVSAGGLVFFGSSADDSVRCLSLETGEQRWAFVTGGPVRFAPHVVSDRVYFASDDGFVYCLDASDGKIVWKFRAAPNERQLVGNGRMISRWPLRSGVLVIDGVVYVTAGMWPAEGVFVYALDAKSGRVRWANDTSGTLNQPTANRTAYTITGVAPTGYLLAANDVLVVPTGRSMPASYSQQDGRLLASTAPSYQNRRGGPAECIDVHGSVIFGYPRERLTGSDYSVRYAHKLPNLTPYGAFRGDRVLSADRTFLAVNDLMRCLDINSRYTKGKVIWQEPCPSKKLRCLALSANALLLGIDDSVVARDRKTGRPLWDQSGLDGYVHSIAVADERLLVATDSGSIYCFAATKPGVSAVLDRLAETPIAVARTTAAGKTNEARLFASIAANKLHRGQALVIGETDTKLAVQIAAMSELQVVLLLDDPRAVATARQTLLDTFAPGQGQVSVRNDVARHPLPFADFAFNLIVAKGDVATERASELHRVLRPAGGMLHIMDAGDDEKAIEAAMIRAAQIDSSDDDKTREASGPSELSRVEPRSLLAKIANTNRMLIFRRGKLPGSLDWDSETSTDQRVKWPLELLWFGGPGSKRTGSGSRAPIAAGGRNFVIGKNHLIALDAYNGAELWSRTLPYLYRKIGGLRNMPGPIQPWLTQSINADDNHVWLNCGHVVYTLDAATGRQLAVHGKLPAAPVKELADEGLRIVMNQFQKPGPRGVTSETHESPTPAGQIRINAIDDKQLTISLELQPDIVIDDRVYWELFLDVRPPSHRANLYDRGIFQLIAWPSKGTVTPGAGVAHPMCSVEVENEGKRLVISIDLKELTELRVATLDDFCFAAALNHPTGADQKSMAGNRAYLRWEHYADAFATSLNNGWPRIRRLRASDDLENDSHMTRELRPISELPKLALTSGRIGEVGQRAGSIVKLSGMRETPLSLEESVFEFNRGKGCGRLVGAGSLQVLRSGTLAFYDLQDDSGMRYFGGVRPACSISAVPAQGLVFAAEGSSGCSCNYNFKTTLALAPAKQRRHEDWAMFTAPLSPGALLRTGKFNLAAPGDRRGDDGGLWLQYPRAPTYSSRVLATVAGTIPVPVQLLGSQLKPYRVNADRVPIANTDRPWLYASGYEGIEGVRLQLFMSDKEGIVVFPGEAPTLDAKLEPKTWERRYSAPAGKGSSLFLSHDDRALYVGYEVVPPLDRRGKQLPWTTREGRKLPCSARFGASDRSSDTAVWEEDSLEFLISDTSLKTILHFGVGITGGRYDSTWSATGKKENTAANPIWSGAISVQADKAIAEFAVPWQTLRDAGLNLNDLVIRPRTRGPLKRQPHISHGFRPVIVKNSKPATRHYRVALHFAELGEAAPGDRVFDIKIQGKTVLPNFDPVRVAGGSRRATVQTFANVEADRALDIQFVSEPNSANPIRPPILSAVEVLLEKE